MRYNIRTYGSAGVVEVIKGRQKAETTMGSAKTGGARKTGKRAGATSSKKPD